MGLDPHDILGVTRHSSETDLKRAYRQAAKDHHPDRGGDVDLYRQAHQAYMTIVELRSEEARAEAERAPSLRSAPFAKADRSTDLTGPVAAPKWTGPKNPAAPVPARPPDQVLGEEYDRILREAIETVPVERPKTPLWAKLKANGSASKPKAQRTATPERSVGHSKPKAQRTATPERSVGHSKPKAQRTATPERSVGHSKPKAQRTATPERRTSTARPGSARVRPALPAVSEQTVTNAVVGGISAVLVIAAYQWLFSYLSTMQPEQWRQLVPDWVSAPSWVSPLSVIALVLLAAGVSIYLDADSRSKKLVMFAAIVPGAALAGGPVVFVAGAAVTLYKLATRHR